MMIWCRQWLLITQYVEICLHPHAVKYTTWYVGSIKCHHVFQTLIYDSNKNQIMIWFSVKSTNLKPTWTTTKIIFFFEEGESTRKKWKRKDIPHSQMNSKRFRNTRCHLNKIKIESYTTYLSVFRRWRHS